MEFKRDGEPQTIDTAPKDGTYVLINCYVDELTSSRDEDGVWWSVAFNFFEETGDEKWFGWKWADRKGRYDKIKYFKPTEWTTIPD